jgi:dephospho-CoA kinase
MSEISKIIAFVGMPGSGKSTCVDYIKSKGIPFTYFGGIVVDEVKNRGMEVNEANEKFVANDIRAKEGKDALAKRIIAQVNVLIKDGNKRVIVDGIYSWTEYKIFEQEFGENITFIAITAPRSSRHQRLANRPVRPLDEKSANDRDYREIEDLEKGGPIANADYTLVNDGALDELLSKLQSILNEIGY